MKPSFYIKKSFTGLLFLCFLYPATGQNTVKPNVKAPNGFEVNSFTGNLYHQRTDMKMPAQGLPMELQFSYNNTQRDKNWGFGRGWTFTYNVGYTADSAGNISLLRADGRKDIFKKSGAVYLSPPGVFDTLIQYQPGKFRMNTKDGWSYFFDEAIHKKMTGLQDRNGNSIIINYTDSLPSAITDAAGRSFSLQWSAGKLSGIENNCASPARKISFLYDTAGNPVKVIQPDSSYVQYHYDSHNRIIGFTDEPGNNMSITYNINGAVSKIVSCATTQLFTYSPTTRKTFVTELVQNQRQISTYSYDTSGRLMHKEGNCCGYNVSYQYDADNNITEQTNGNNQTTKYEYDANGNMIKETDAMGNIVTYSWHATFNKILSVTDKRGNTTTFEYDANGNLTRINKPLGVTEIFTYDVRGNSLTHKDGNNHVTAHEYNNFGQLTKITDPLNGITINTYDGCGNMIQQKDPRNSLTGFEYDVQNRLKKVTDALGNSTRYTYDAAGNITAVTDALNRVTTYVYDGLGRRIRTVSPAGHTAAVEYDERNNRTKITDAKGNSTVYTYNSRNQPLTEIDALGNTKSFEYDGVGNLTRETDKRGNITQYEYDKLNRLVKVTNADGNTNTANYDAAGNRIAATDFNGNMIFFAYDALNRRTTITDPFNKTIAYTYDANNNILTQKDKNNNTWATAYDALDREIKSTDPLGHFTETVYDANGNRLSFKNQLGFITTNTYDVLNRPLTETNPLNEVTSYTYDSVGNAKTISHPNGNTITNTYNSENRLTTVTDVIGTVGIYTYDANGNRLTEKDANNNTVTYLYDKLNRITGITDPLGNTATKQYDANGNIITETDRNNNSKIFEYDKLNRVNKETDALGNATRFGYDGNGNRITIIDAKSNITSYNFDALNRLIKEIYADGTNKQYTYDGNGNRKTRKDNNGIITNYAYDALNHLTLRSYPGNISETFSYDAMGRRLTANNDNATITFSYDNLGRMLSETLNGKTTGYAYNTVAGTKTLTYPGGRVVTETRDQRDRLVIIAEGANSIAQFGYDNADRLTSKALGNGVSQNYGYDHNNRITSLDCQPNNVLGFQYTYDKEGNRLTTLKNHRITHSEKYQYDNIYQLTRFYTGKINGTTFTDTTSKNIYSYDALHNRIMSMEDTVNKVYSINSMNAYTRVVTNAVPSDYFYDANGNTTGDGVNTYQYDKENKLTSIVGSVQYLFDAFGRKIKSVNNGNEIDHFYANNQIIEERDGNNVLQKTYVFGTWIDDLITYTYNNSIYYTVTNQLGEVLVAYNGTNAIEKYEYGCYGTIIRYDNFFNSIPNSLINNNIGFHGRNHLSNTIIDFRSRSYQNGNGRFFQKDFAGYSDGYNMYTAYFIPNHSDPFGINKDNRSIGVEISNYLYAGYGGGWSFGVTYSDQDCCKDKNLIPGGDREIELKLHVEGGVGIAGKLGLKIKGYQTSLELGYKHAFLNYDMPFTLKNSECGGPLDNARVCYEFAVNLLPSYSLSVFPIDLSADLFVEGRLKFCVESKYGSVGLSTSFCKRIGGTYTLSLARSFVDLFDISTAVYSGTFDFVNDCELINGLSGKINF